MIHTNNQQPARIIIIMGSFCAKPDAAPKDDVHEGEKNYQEGGEKSCSDANVEAKSKQQPCDKDDAAKDVEATDGEAKCAGAEGVEATDGEAKCAEAEDMEEKQEKFEVDPKNESDDMGRQADEKREEWEQKVEEEGQHITDDAENHISCSA